jgi:hypothetical protein
MCCWWEYKRTQLPWKIVSKKLIITTGMASGRVPSLQAESPEFKPQSHKKQNKIKTQKVNHILAIESSCSTLGMYWKD